MLETLKNNIPSIIALIGFIISYFTIRLTYRNDIKKLKAEKIYNKIENLPYEILQIMYDISKHGNNDSRSNKNVENLASFMNNVIAYGSSDAVKIAAAVQKAAYKNEKTYRLLAAYSLLVTQLKYDLSGILISPSSYFEIKITDYDNLRDQINMQINTLVDELKINDKFHV